MRRTMRTQTSEVLRSDCRSYSPDDEVTGRVVVIDPDNLFRECLVCLLASYLPNAQIEAAPCAAAVRAGAASLVLIGANPRRDIDPATLAATVWAARELCEGAPIGAYLLEHSPKLVRDLAALGAVGVILAEAGVDVAVAAVHLMMLGGYCLPPDHCLARESAIAVPSPAPAVPDSEAVDSDCAPANPAAPCSLILTARECEVLNILREGRQNKLIAYQLGISESTVKVHLRNIMKKLNVTNRTQIVLGAVGLFSSKNAAPRPGATVQTV